jgi:hypothetical protein
MRILGGRFEGGEAGDGEGVGYLTFCTSGMGWERSSHGSENQEEGG